MKKILITLLAGCLLMAGCNNDQQEARSYAALSVSTSLVQTKSEALEDIKTSMRVFIIGRSFNESYLFSELPDVLYVPVDSEQSYVVAAQNVTQEDALAQPDVWGQKRYAGFVEILLDRIAKPGSDEQYVYSIEVPCSIVNSMVSVAFDPTIEEYLTDYSVTVYTDEERKLIFDASNASSALAHFTSGKCLKCRFSGMYNVTGEIIEYLFDYNLLAADHITFTVSLKNVDGSLGKPEINVDKTCGEFEEDVEVDPSDNGVIE